MLTANYQTLGPIAVKNQVSRIKKYPTLNAFHFLTLYLTKTRGLNERVSSKPELEKLQRYALQLRQRTGQK